MIVASKMAADAKIKAEDQERGRVGSMRDAANCRGERWRECVWGSVARTRDREHAREIPSRAYSSSSRIRGHQSPAEGDVSAS